MKGMRAILALVATAVVLLMGCAAGGTALEESPAAAASPTSATDPDSGLAWVAVDELPPEAGDTLALIDAGGPYPHEQDGWTFGNFEGLLPQQDRGYYTEYTVDTPGSDDRGARRIVAGVGGDFYYTGDHYSSFRRISR